MGMEEVNETTANLVETHFSVESMQDRAIALIGNILSTCNLPIIERTLQFLRQLPREATEIWIQGFLGESLIVNSCNPGALERVVTSSYRIA